MASLREIKDRIASVRSTLKITSAMKLVASSKLHKAQQAVEDLLPYEKELHSILQMCSPSLSSLMPSPETKSTRVAVVAVSSNSSMCGAFNSNVIRETLSQLSALEDVDVFPVGRKITDALRRAGYLAQSDLNSLVAHPSFEASSALATSLCEAFASGKYSRVLLVYNHFVSTSSQKVIVEDYLRAAQSPDNQEDAESRFADFPNRGTGNELTDSEMDDYIFEPSKEEIAQRLLPQVMKLKMHGVILDSVAAEHAARTVAMQTATDNAQSLLADLTLEYNKGRQQKITSEILDLLGGAAQ